VAQMIADIVLKVMPELDLDVCFTPSLVEA
jgi:hypothetical protein